ncbi:hypothetical protein RHSIM_Rhsim11G0028900 [Rhododendron simsii]|uniref:GPI mannosyltransferase 1 n=1 Tax=Rhododendron simsii TaxID=118357 RepID=A0A834G966_RHOSS|nr:hypothetical protein RHSIM_Rhsim11G0028900 [Rhododendron simsii]
MPSIDLHSLLLFSAVLRLLLILYGEWQDTHMGVRYTDVDYLVFSDAASLMASGKSPYERTTYRYSPLIAFLLIPNSLIHRSWGKFLFSASDLLVGLFIHYMLKLRKVPENLCSYSVMVWLFNTFTFTIGTCGNCKPIVCVMVLWIIICLINCITSYTVAFVAFNKVITAQYFVWFFCLLPLILPWSNMKLKWKGFTPLSGPNLELEMDKMCALGYGISKLGHLKIYENGREMKPDATEAQNATIALRSLENSNLVISVPEIALSEKVVTSNSSVGVEGHYGLSTTEENADTKRNGKSETSNGTNKSWNQQLELKEGTNNGDAAAQ